MKKLKIAFDLDGVVYDFINPLDSFLNKNGFKIVNEKEYDIGKRYCIGKDEADNILNKWGETRPFVTIPIIERARKEIIKLKNHELYIITHRNWVTSGIRDTLNRVIGDRLPVDIHNIFFSEKKGELAKKIGIDIFYEDSIININDILYQSDANIVLVDAPYNRGLFENNNRVRRVMW